MSNKPSILITPRDERLILDAYQSVVINFEQIRNRHFSGRALPTVCNRLRRLADAGLIARQHLGVQLYHGSPRRIGSVYQLTRGGLRWLRFRYPEASFREEPVPLNSASLSHDLLLSDVIRDLKRRFPDHRIIHGKLWKGPDAGRARIPDAVIEGGGPKERWAVELELTVKSRSRYREIITSYRLWPAFTKVLYLVPALSIQRAIETEILGYKIPERGLPVSTGKFYFGQIGALRQSPEGAPIRNGLEDLGDSNSTQNGFIPKEVCA